MFCDQLVTWKKGNGRHKGPKGLFSKWGGIKNISDKGKEVRRVTRNEIVW